MSAPDWEHLDEINTQLSLLAGGLKALALISNTYQVQAGTGGDEAEFAIRGLQAIAHRLDELHEKTRKAAQS